MLYLEKQERDLREARIKDLTSKLFLVSLDRMKL